MTKASYQRIHTVWFHLYKIKKQAKPIQAVETRRLVTCEERCDNSQGARRHWGLQCPVAQFGSLLTWVSTVCEHSLNGTPTISVLYFDKKGLHLNIEWDYSKNCCARLIKKGWVGEELPSGERRIWGSEALCQRAPGQIPSGLSPVRWKGWLWSASNLERVSRSLARPLWTQSSMAFWAWDTPPWLLEGWLQCSTTWWLRTWWTYPCFLSTWVGKARQACQAEVSYTSRGTARCRWEGTRRSSHTPGLDLLLVQLRDVGQNTEPLWLLRK